MATLEMPSTDIETGRRSSAVKEMPSTDIETGRRSSAVNVDEEEEGDRSPLFSAAAGPSDCSVVVEIGENKVDSDNVERECRICQLSLISSSPGPGCSPGPGVAIELGCSCKDDLAAVHKHCAETWFKIKGNKICEICNEVAQNVIVTIEIEQQGSETRSVGSTASRPSNAAAQRCLNGHRLLNFMLACMVFAFVLSWLFHFNIPS